MGVETGRGLEALGRVACLGRAAGDWWSTPEILLFAGSNGAGMHGNVQCAELGSRVCNCPQACCFVERVILH